MGTSQQDTPELSVIVPAYNEERTIRTVLERVIALPLPIEVIVVDDGSEDDTVQQARSLEDPRVTVVRKPVNEGKGSAVRLGLARARGKYVVVQDADLEYDPTDLARMVICMRKGARVVYGNRWHAGNPRYSYRRYLLGGRFVTSVACLLYHLHIHDEPTCYKMFRREDLQQLNLRARGFEFCPEVTAKAARLGWRIHEIPIRYEPRSFEEGKKISWKDGVRAIWELLRWRFMPISSFYKPGKAHGRACPRN